MTLDSVRGAVSATLPPAGGQPPPALIPFGAQAKKALELTVQEARRLGHDYAGTEHLLLALLELEAGQGPLASLSLGKAAIQEWVTAAGRGRQGRAAKLTAQPPGNQRRASQRTAHSATPQPPLSAQPQRSRTENPQASVLRIG